jgi:hypothetical protein
MATYMKFELEDGTTVFIETADTPKSAGGLIPSRSAAETAAQAGISFEKAVDGVKKMAAAMMQQFQTGFSQQPSEIAINFGLKAAGELGSLVVSRGGVEANYNVSLRWSKDKDSSDKKDE